MLENLIRFSYPFPISATYQNIENIVYPDRMPHKFNRMIDLYDSILKTLSYYLVCFAHSRSLLDVQLKKQLEISLANPTPTNWTMLLTKLIKNLSPSQEPIVTSIKSFYLGSQGQLPNLRNASYYMRDVPPPLNDINIMTIEKFFEIYNQFISATDLSRLDYVKAVNVLLPAFKEILERLEFLADYIPVYIADVRKKGNLVEYQLITLSGLTQSSQIITLDNIISKGRKEVYLFKNTQDGLVPSFSLYPLIIVNKCLIHQKDEIYFLRYSTSEEMEYYCFQCRERFKPDRLMTDFQKIIRTMDRDKKSDKKDKSAPEENVKIFRELLKSAWQDGVMTDEEREKVEFLRKELDISSDLAADIENSVKQQLGHISVELDLADIRLFEQIVKNSIIKNNIAPAMRSYIELLREKLAIPLAYAKKIESRLWHEEGLKKMRQGDSESARICFINASAADENNELARRRLAELSIEDQVATAEIEHAILTGAKKKKKIQDYATELIYPKEALMAVEAKGPLDEEVSKIQAASVREMLLKEPLVKVTEPILHSRGRPRIFKKSKLSLQEQELVKAPSPLFDSSDFEEDIEIISGTEEVNYDALSGDDSEEGEVIYEIDIPEAEEEYSGEVLEPEIIETEPAEYPSEFEGTTTEPIAVKEIERTMPEVPASAEVAETSVEAEKLQPVREKELIEIKVPAINGGKEKESAASAEKSTKMMTLAKKLLQEKKYAQALKELNGLISIDPQNLAAKLLRARCAMEEEEFALAFSDLEEVMKIKSDDVTLLMMHGKAALEVGNFEPAIQDFNVVLEKQPNNIDAAFNRGAAYLEKGSFKKAIKDFNNVINLKPDFTDAYIDRGNCWMELGEYKKAIEDYKKALKIDPNDAYPYYKQGQVHAQLKNYDKALAFYDKAISIEQDVPEYYWGRIYVLKELEKYKEAIKDIDVILQLEPNSKLALQERAKLLNMTN